MSEMQMVKKWIKDKEHVVFWGASSKALEKLNSIEQNFVLIPFSVVDNNLAGNVITIGRKEVVVEKPEKYLGQNVKWILLVTRRQSFAEVFSYLKCNHLEYEFDFVDGMQLGDGDWELPHGNISEKNVYMPWSVDDDFIDLRSKIARNTLVDEYRCYELRSLVKQSKRCKEGDIIEIGVWRGGTGALIAKTAQDEQIPATVFLADTFEGVVKTSDVDIYYRDGAHDDTSQVIVEELLKEMAINNVEIIKGIFPDAFYERFKCNKWRFVHIDVDVYLSAKEIFEYVWPNMESGGCVVFDDYGFASTVGVTRLCNELADEIKDGVFIYNLNQHAVFVKV